MRFRKLRIAWSIFWGSLCLLMIAWWIRSYWWQDQGFVKLTPSKYVSYNAGEGRMCLWFEYRAISKWYDWSGRPIENREGPNMPNRIPWLDIGFWPHMTRVYAAHCFLTLVFGSLVGVAWCPTRFSIRGILTATAAIVTVLGVIIWVDNTI